MAEDSNNNTDVFVYMGGDWGNVPQHTSRLRVHPSVTVIPDQAAFRGLKQLCRGG